MNERAFGLEAELRYMPHCWFHQAISILERCPHPDLVKLFLLRDDWKNIAIDKAISVAHHLLNADIILSVVSREDCSLSEAIALANKNRHSPIIDAIISRDDWDDLTFWEIIKLAKQSEWRHLIVKIAIYRDEWKKMSFEEAVELIKKSEWALSVVEAVVSRDDCSLERAIELAKLKDWNIYIAEAITSRSDWENLPLDEAVEMFQLSEKNSDWNNHFIYSAILRDDCSLEKAIILAKMTSSSGGTVFDFYVTKLIASRDDWKKLTQEEIARLRAWNLYRWMDIRGFIPKK